MQWVPELVIGLTLLTVSFDGKGQQQATSAKEEAESYDIYSTVLKIKGPSVAEWTIVRETRRFEMCLKPARDQESSYLDRVYAAAGKVLAGEKVVMGDGIGER